MTLAFTEGKFPYDSVDYSLLLAAGLGLVALPALAAAYPGHPTTTPDINAADLSARDKAISDDAFEGRGPGTVNGEAAAQWIADEMKRIGLKPGNHGCYFQTVPAVNITLDAAKSSLVFDTAKGADQSEIPGRGSSTGRRNSRAPTSR